MRAPDLSVVVVVHNVAREAPRTLLSLSASYQRHIAAADYEVIVVDNGSTPPFDASVIEGLAGNFRLIRMDDPASPSPASAINRGLAHARGEIIGIIIDGARLVTPGLLHFARRGARLYPRPVVACLGWYLGFDVQRWAMEAGYDQAREDALLAKIDWPADGYRLFEIGTLDGSSSQGWLQPIAESNALFLRRETWETLGDVDERFAAPGGGFVNLDTFRRAAELPGSRLVMLLGEGTFHQLHGGVATNSTFAVFSNRLEQWRAQYEAIRGRPWTPPRDADARTYLGVLPRPALAHFVRAALARDGARRPVARPPADPRIASLARLAETEFQAGRFEACAAVARLARLHAPDEPQHLLAYAGAWLPGAEPAEDRRAGFHLALGAAYRLLGDDERSAAEYRTAMSLDGDLPQAHVGLAELRMPGEACGDWLDRFHAALVPETYVEIGVGQSLALAHPPTRAIAIDPAPAIQGPLRTEAHLFPETSDAFFARGGLAPLLDGRSLGLGFIDGPRRFEQVLRDFIHLEASCGPRSVILLRHTMPLDEPSQSRVATTRFHPGDVWKVVPCLKHYRPDLDTFTIAAPWSGLTVVIGLDPSSRTLSDRYHEAVARFADTPWSEIESCLEMSLGVVVNDWSVVSARLRGRGIL